VPHCFQIARAWRRGALAGIARPAQGLQAALAPDKKFRIGGP
jgi:hypothetical protein